MSIKVTLHCRNCDAYSYEILEDSTVSNFQSSEVSSFCTICENDSRVNIKVEEYVHRDLKSDKKSLLYIQENSFTTALLLALIFAFCLFVISNLQNPNWWMDFK